jgi:acetoin utilization protein AcuB
LLVQNWMQRNPLTVPSDTLVSEAKRIISENNLHALPVVDDGRLRGLVTRANLLRQALFVLRTQSQDELCWFVNRIRVRDVMVRDPMTIQASETVERCLQKGREAGVAQFPVLDGDRLVGVISANEIFQLAAHFVGSWERRNGLTLAPVRLGRGVLGRIVDVSESAGAAVHAVYPLGWHDGREHDAEKAVILRFHAHDTAAVVAALEAAGFPVVESSRAPESHLVA